MKQKNIYNLSIVILLFVVTLFSKNAHAQCVIPPKQYINTGGNMTILLLTSFFDNLPNSSEDPYLVILNSTESIVCGAQSLHPDSLIYTSGSAQQSVAIWADDTFTNETDGALEGETVILKYVDGNSVYTVTPTVVVGSGPITYTTNSQIIVSGCEIDFICSYDINLGCTDSLACNYNPDASSDDGSCVFIQDECDVCVNGLIVDGDTDDDGVCEVDEIAGCMDESACNFNPLATNPPYDITSGSDTTVNPMACYYDDSDNDGVCDVLEISGCTDSLACNYDEDPTTDSDNSLCVFAFGCDSCLETEFGTWVVIDNDLDDDGICNDDEIIGCLDSLACNFNITATDSAYCLLPVGCETCSGETDGTGTIVDNDSDDDGVCDDDEVLGCTDILACSYSELATEFDSSCLYFDSCGVCDGNSSCAVFIEDNIQIIIDETLVEDSAAIETFGNNFEDLMETQLDLPEGCVVVIEIIFLNRGDLEIEVVYTITLTEEEIEETDLNSNLQPEDIITQINQEIIEIVTEEQVFNNIEFIEGCTNSSACNFDIDANIDVGCILPVDCESCSGQTDGSGYLLDNDIDSDGVCDFEEITGCNDVLACNYDATPTTDSDNSLCNYSIELDQCATCSGDQDGSGYILDNDLDDDGVCNQFEISGCKDASACNYDALFTTDQDNSLCLFPTGCESCSGATDGFGYVIENDVDGDGVCDGDEITGCTNQYACNYDASSTTDTDNTLCIYSADMGACASCSGQSDGSGYIVDNDSDNDGICNQYEIEGCVSISACNYNVLATDDDGSCIYPESQYDCDGNCLSDFDNDGICDPFEIIGCTDNAYLEYDELATENNGSCATLIVLGCLDDSYLEYAINANVNDSSLCITLIVFGCTDPLACNYNSDANISDDSCELVDGICDTCEDGFIVNNDADGDGVCDANEVVGCMESTACNYMLLATDSADCIYSTDIDACASCSGAQDGTGIILDNDIDDDGVCDSDEIIGCTDALACNYDATPTTDSDNSLCNYSTDLDDCATCSGEIDGTGIIVDNDTDDDGICNEEDNCIDVVNSVQTDTDNDGVGDACDYDDGIGVNELLNSPINLYPNPSKDFINLDFESNLSNISVEILNTLGDLFIVESVDEISSRQTMQIPVHNLPSGLYLIMIKSDHELHRFNWIKN